jgi:GT2 family glycosyltransferase
MSDQSTVAVIIPTFNRQAKLLRFLDLIQQQTYADLQVIVVDSSSIDGTSDLVREKFSQVTLIQVSDHNFWTGATNAGVKLALDRQVDFILTINDDALIPSDHIKKLVDLAQQHQLSIVGNRIDYLTPKNKVWSLGTYSDWGTDRFLKIAYNDQDLSTIPSDILTQELIAVDALPGNGVLIRRSVFDQTGLYNAKFCPHYHADSEFIMRAKKAGFDAWIAPQIVLQNDFSNDQKNISPKNLAGLKYIFFNPKSHLFMPSILYTIWKYCPPQQRILTLLKLFQRFKNTKYK